MRIAVLDGYTDEPACLGVPPYIAPQIRYIAGAITDSGSEYIYLTIDDYRTKPESRQLLEKCNILLVNAGAVVPGKYLGGAPISNREAKIIAEDFNGITILGGSAGRYGFFDSKTGASRSLDNGPYDHLSRGDVDAAIFDFLKTGEYSHRKRTSEEHNSWAIKGASVVLNHPNFPSTLIAELESYRGCTRYITGGCSFCIEPQHGEPIYREQADIIDEVETLKNAGVRHFRLGAQSCIYSYKAKGVGSTQTPEPDPRELEKLLGGLRRVIGPTGLLHVDNANPAVIADYPTQSAKITKLLVKYCSSGNVVAFGMESADPVVVKANNLNATAEQVMNAIALVNKHGNKIGSTGLPSLLPGLNFIAGLNGESRNTYQLNIDFLNEVKSKGHLLRRINIRQVSETRVKFKKARPNKYFRNFKKHVREEIDRPMLEKIAPFGTILRSIFTEVHDGNITFGRQLGTYPLLVGIPYKLPLGKELDVYITGHGFRSITGVEFPFPINEAPMSHIKALPRLGAKRAARIVRGRPYSSTDELDSILDDPDVARTLREIITIKSSSDL